MDYEAILSRHKKIALQFSGGKDSIAVLHLMRPYWDCLTVYYVNSGDAPRETLYEAQKARDMVPNFKYLEGNVHLIRKTFGYPKEADKVSCCYLSIMLPMQLQMAVDKITLIIRGQKLADKHRGLYKTGDKAGGYEFLYPLDDWSDNDVFEYLRKIDVPVPPFYAEGCLSAPDCLMCTAWTEHHGQEYVMRHYPDLAGKLQEKMRTIYGHPNG